MNRGVPFVIIGAIILLAFVYSAYAEEYVVDVPFAPQGWGCAFDTNTNDTKKYHCTFEWQALNSTLPGEITPPSVDGCAHGFDINGKTGECQDSQELQKEAREECEATECWKTEEPTPARKRLEELLEIPEDERTSGQRAAIQALENPDSLCNYIIALYQQDSGFRVEVEEFRDPQTGEMKVQLKNIQNDRPIDLQNYRFFAESKKNYQICLGEQKLALQEKIIGPGAITMIPNSHDHQRYHSWTAYDIPEWSQSRVNQEANGNQNPTKINPICAPGSYYSKSTKDVYCKEVIPVRTNGSVEYQSDAEDRWLNYLQDNGTKQYQKAVKAKLQEEISRLFKQLKAQEAIESD